MTIGPLVMTTPAVELNLSPVLVIGKPGTVKMKPLLFRTLPRGRYLLQFSTQDRVI
jgi:hypothetical protein